MDIKGLELIIVAKRPFLRFTTAEGKKGTVAVGAIAKAAALYSSQAVISKWHDERVAEAEPPKPVYRARYNNRVHWSVDLMLNDTQRVAAGNFYGNDAEKNAKDGSR